MKDHAIYIQEMSKIFGSETALDNLNLEVPLGSIFGFLGPNGAGKTTTIRLLLGLLDPTTGKATVLGNDPHRFPDLIRAQTGAMLEHTGIYEQMSAEDNLEFYGRVFQLPDLERKARIQELLSHMGLWERRKDRAGLWSRGMKQKLALARTLLHRPKLILLDEPTAGLDVQSAVAIREDLETLASQEDVTIFLTTHNMTDAEKLCDLVAIIKKGRLVIQGKPDVLRAQNGNSKIEIIGRGFNDRVLNFLSTHPKVRGYHIQNNHIEIKVLEGTQPAELVMLLVNNGIQVDEVQRSKASLEDVYLSYTGE